MILEIKLQIDRAYAFIKYSAFDTDLIHTKLLKTQLIISMELNSIQRF